MDPLRLENFDSKKMNPTEWIQHFERVADVNEWDLAKKAKIVRLYLAHTAADWYDITVDAVSASDLLPTLDEESPKKLTYKTFKRLFLAQFERNTHTKYNLRVILETSKQAEGQPVQEFNVFFANTARKLGENNTEYLLRIYTDAVVPIIRKEIIMAEPRDFETAKEIAERAERANAAIMTPTLPPARSQVAEDKIDALSKALSDLQLNLHNLTQQRYNSGFYHRSNVQYGRNNYDRNNYDRNNYDRNSGNGQRNSYNDWRPQTMGPRRHEEQPINDNRDRNEQDHFPRTPPGFPDRRQDDQQSGPLNDRRRL